MSFHPLPTEISSLLAPAYIQYLFLKIWHFCFRITRAEICNESNEKPCNASNGNVTLFCDNNKLNFTAYFFHLMPLGSFGTSRYIAACCSLCQTTIGLVLYVGLQLRSEDLHPLSRLDESICWVDAHQLPI